MLRGIIDLRHLFQGLRTEEGRSGMTGRRVEEEDCAKRTCALRGAADQKT